MRRAGTTTILLTMAGAAILACPASASSFSAIVGVTTHLGPFPPVINMDSGTEVSPGSQYSELATAGSFVGTLISAGDPGGSINAASGAYAAADAFISDFLFSGPGAIGSTISVTVTLPFTSLSTGEYWTAPFGNSGASGSLAFGVSFGSYAGGLNFGWNEDSYNFAGGGPEWTVSFVPSFGVDLLVCNGTDICAIHNVGYQVNGTVTFTTLVPVGVPVSAQLSVQTSCGTGGIFDANCQVDALDPFGFLPGYASFDLPDGYTVNAESIGLVDGLIPGGGVPEPSTIWLSMFGICSLAGWARRHRMGASAVSARPSSRR